MKISPRKISLIGCVGLLIASATGCGPVYDTRYTFIPPHSETGRVCIFQCENGKLQCAQIQDMRKDTCEDRARREQERCQWQLAYEGKKEKWYDCPLESCDSDTERCESQYRSCYQSCGGRIESQVVCVANCAQVPPPPD